MARECFWCVLGNQVYVSHIAMLYYRSSTVQHLPNLRHVLFTHHASNFNFGLTLHRFTLYLLTKLDGQEVPRT